MLVAAMANGKTALCRAKGHYKLECFDRWGVRKWEVRSDNLVVNVGLKDMCEKYFTGAAYTAQWFVGLYGAAALNDPAPTDTAALHPGWTEVTNYSNLTRPQALFGAATEASPSIITNELSPAQFNIDANGIIGGVFLISDDTKGGLVGQLFSAADLPPPGDRNTTAGDIIVVRYYFELTAV